MYKHLNWVLRDITGAQMATNMVMKILSTNLLNSFYAASLSMWFYFKVLFFSTSC